jgi:hypothetical protein
VVVEEVEEVVEVEVLGAQVVVEVVGLPQVEVEVLGAQVEVEVVDIL